MPYYFVDLERDPTLGNCPYVLGLRVWGLKSYSFSLVSVLPLSSWGGKTNPAILPLCPKSKGPCALWLFGSVRRGGGGGEGPVPE